MAAKRLRPRQQHMTDATNPYAALEHAPSPAPPAPQTEMDEMELAPFEADAFVFEQGDVGDRFYVILTGEAKVLRDEQGLSDQPISSEEIEFEDPEKLLADLGPGSYFGERALLKSEPRFASVQAKTALTTMCLTPACCERALGRPLKDCVPDIY